MREENWSVERFCLGPEVRNIYAQFLYGFPLEYFSFIGITEHYDEDFAFFARRYLDAGMLPMRCNTGNTVGQVYEISTSLRREIEQFHAGDMDLYQRALNKRRLRNSS